MSSARMIKTLGERDVASSCAFGAAKASFCVATNANPQARVNGVILTALS